MAEVNYICVGTSGGMVKIKKTSGATTFYNKANSGLPDNDVRSIAIDGSGNKWFGTDWGLAKFDGTNWTICTTSNSGLPDSAVRESRERVNAAIKNSNLPFPQKRITINLAPADVRKEGSAFDLPIAIGILAASGVVSQDHVQDYVILGELSLDGSLRPIHGALPIAVEISKIQGKGIVLPVENASEAAMAQGVNVHPVGSLTEAIAFLNGDKPIAPFKVSLEDGMVTISRAALSLTYPAQFMLAAAINSSPCGYATDPSHECSFASQHIQKYLSKISGPLLDRIDIHI